MSAVVENLRARLQKLETHDSRTREMLPFGVPPIDEHLPDGGLALGAFHEVAGGGNGAMHCAAATLFTAGVLARTSGPILWCMKQRDLFAPAMAQVGLAMNRVIFVEAGDEKSVLACFEEGLRHGGVTAVVGEVGKLSMTASRRLQLAAEGSDTIGIAIRRFWRKSDEEELNQPTASRTRWRVTARPSTPLPVPGVGRGHWFLELLRCRGGVPANFDVEACDEEGRIALSANLAHGSGTAEALAFG